MKGRIKAFTLIEVVLAMMLAAVVIGMAYIALDLMGGMYGSYREKNLAHADVQLLRQVLQRDAERAEQLNIEENMMRLQSAEGLLSYEWQQDMLLRKTASVQDTFRLKGLAVQSYFENRPIHDGITDRLVLRFEQDSLSMQLSLHKSYDSRELFELKRD